MTDPDMIALSIARRAARDTVPDSIESAVRKHIDLALPPTDAEVFDGIPTALPDEITGKVEPTNVNDDDWDEIVTGVHPTLDRLTDPNKKAETSAVAPFDHSFCMM